MKYEKTIAIIAAIIVFFLAAFASNIYFKGSQVVLAPTANNIASTTITVSTTTVATASVTSQVKLFYVAIGDAGKLGKKIGCDDSIVPITYNIVPTHTPLASALERLLKEKSAKVGTYNWYNSLAQSNLKLTSASVANGVATINIEGQTQLGGVCDIPRVKSQIEETVAQFPSVKSVQIFLNGKSIDEALSQK